MGSLVSPTQSAFVAGRHILDSPLIVGETVAWAKKHKRKMMIYKVDFQRAYDSLNWKFLFKVMEYMDFPKKWVTWISGCLKSGRGSVLVNGSPTEEFQYKRGLRQGDPISPFLFILALEVLVMFVNKSVDIGLFHGLKLTNDGPVLSHLCYADDVLFIGEWSDHNAMSLKRLLRCLFLVSGLKVNDHKCHLYGVGVSEVEITRLARVLNCGIGKFPFYYLGIPVGANMKRSNFWKPIVEKFRKKLSGWKARHLSLAGRVTLAKSVLGSLPSYYLSLFPAPKGVIKQLEGIRRDFVWGKTGRSQKMRWVKWELFLKPKILGGVGVGGILDYNIAMLSKWLWRYKNEPNHLWTSVIRAIHESSTSKSFISVKKTIPGVWKDIHSVKDSLQKFDIKVEDCIRVKMGDGKSILFWMDRWLIGEPLKDRFPELFNIAANKRGTVDDFYHAQDGNIQWRWKWITDPQTRREWEQISALMNLLQQARFSKDKDKWYWINDVGDDFSAKSIRSQIMSHRSTDANSSQFFWNAWATSKSNFITWRAILGRVPTKLELRQRGIPLINVICDRCGYGTEDFNHAFVNCLLARGIWWNIFVWIRVPMPDNANSVQNIIEALDNAPGSKKWKRLVNTVMKATFWRIWYARNQKVFEGISFRVLDLVEKIKEDSFLWIKHRSNLPDVTWESWLNFDVLSLL
ncbi:putative RNA-directed DNA polymerase [Helianthus annuus]|nr:putative RNA-directed DNA polymerase [Helianthus annuus]